MTSDASTSLPVRIERLAKGGDGVAHTGDGRVAFVPGTCPGDLVRIRVTEDHGSHVRASVAELLEPAEDRIPSACPLAEQCAGCQWRHVSYERQLTEKRAEIADSLSHIGHLDPTVVSPAVPSPVTEGYRNKLEFTLGRESGKLRLGFAAGGGILTVQRCPLLPPRYAGAPKALAGALAYLGKGSDLGVERVQLRVSVRTGELEIALWSRPGEFPRGPAAKVLGHSLPATSIVRILYRGEAKRRRVGNVEVLSGKGYWTEKLAGFAFAVSAPSFFQVNTAAAETLVSLVADAALERGARRIFDVYAGVGTFTLPLAQRGADVSAFEVEGSAVRDLRRNLDRNRLAADVVPGDAARSLHEAGEADCIVVDPPRAGLSPDSVAAVVQARADRIVYVSCDPATLARDLASLNESGYSLTRVAPVDLFPYTYHIESVAVLDRR